MDERTALAVTAVRAVELSDRGRAVWTDADRAWASRAAAEAVGAEAPPGQFVGRRALLALERLYQRRNRVARLAHVWRWRAWISPTLALVAFALGVVFDVLGGARRINVLYSPVAPLVAWNLAIYVALAAGFVLRYGTAGVPGPLRSGVAWLAGVVRGNRGAYDQTEARALSAFAEDWTRLATPLYAARAARTLHVAAAALALGVVAGLYLRGLGLEYRATWESTFLEPWTVHRIVDAMYAPGAWLLSRPVPDFAQVASIRAPGSANAATWLHLMAGTLAVAVIVPRLLLALVMAGIERHRASLLYADPDDPYFQRLLRGLREGSARVDVVPYSFTAPANAAPALEAMLARSLGGTVSVALAPAVSYGGEVAPVAALQGPSRAPLVALFNATATPEREAHGRFVASLAQSGRPLVIVVDEAAFNERWSADARRRDQRRGLWREFATEAGRAPVFVNLSQPDLDAAEADFDAALDHSPR